jgi:hypothetical protein
MSLHVDTYSYLVAGALCASSDYRFRLSRIVSHKMTYVIFLSNITSLLSVAPLPPFLRPSSAPKIRVERYLYHYSHSNISSSKFKCSINFPVRLQITNIHRNFHEKNCLLLVHYAVRNNN